MEKSRHGKHSKDKSKKSKKRRRRDENGTPCLIKPLVEYSDVSSEDLSGPEAGEIQSGEEEGSVKSVSEDGELDADEMQRNHRARYSRIDEELYIRESALLLHSPGNNLPFLLVYFLLEISNLK